MRKKLVKYDRIWIFFQAADDFFCEFCVNTNFKTLSIQIYQQNPKKSIFLRELCIFNIKAIRVVQSNVLKTFHNENKFGEKIYDVCDIFFRF